MNLHTAVEKLSALSEEKQATVLDFIEFLSSRPPTSVTVGERRRLALRDEPFIGMWADREDLADSTAWVRALRGNEWHQ
ncbi:hypothetical protein [Candidatus Thiosymbion oneisti]|uniref:hypothetical protein n=1 Tax=Candidatus Thiosymbion oneisti TaxID=589554 RepID=UPI000B7CDA76|nr:hypothetical protein [Candidatus Thiosymbion oneisti]